MCYLIFLIVVVYMSDIVSIDVMHVGKNVCHSVIETLINIQGKTQHGLNARLDMVEMVTKHICLQLVILVKKLDKKLL